MFSISRFLVSGFGLRFPIPHDVALVGEHRLLDRDGPIAEVVGGEHLREIEVAVVESVVQGEGAKVGAAARDVMTPRRLRTFRDVSRISLGSQISVFPTCIWMWFWCRARNC